MMTKLEMIAFVSLGFLCAPAFAENPAQPGTVNYVEGAASIEGQPIAKRSIGNLTLEPGQVLTTQAGKAEILLTPGVFLRVGDNSAMKMISPDLTHTQVELLRGRAGVEVDEIYPKNNLDVIDAGVTTQLVKPGYYEFDANRPEVMVFDGKAAVEIPDGKFKVVKEDHELALTALADGGPLATEKAVRFDPKAAQDDLYNWNSLRSEYLSEANNQIAGEYAYANGFEPGWYWDPYAWNYTFVGLNPYWSPFGWGFYPYGWGGWYGGWYGGHSWHGHPHYRFSGRGQVENLHGGPVRSGGFHGGTFHGTFHGSGFHGSGGFHSGGGRR